MRQFKQQYSTNVSDRKSGRKTGNQPLLTIRETKVGNNPLPMSTPCRRLSEDHRWPAACPNQDYSTPKSLQPMGPSYASDPGHPWVAVTQASSSSHLCLPQHSAQATPTPSLTSLDRGTLLSSPVTEREERKRT